MSTDNAVFVLEQLKYKATDALMGRVEKHLKDHFYSKWLPQTLKEIRTNLTIDLVNDNDLIEIQIKVKNEQNKITS